MLLLCLYLHGVDPDGLLEAVHTLLEVLGAQVQQGFGAHGPGTAPSRQLPGTVVVLMLPQNISQQAVQAGCLLLLQLTANNLLSLSKGTVRRGGVRVGEEMYAGESYCKVKGTIIY